jgi:predicted nucleic acid-binding protein
MITMSDSIALDTNVLIYLHDSLNPNKRIIAQNLLADSPCISAQVLSEYLNTTRRLLALSKEELLIQTAGLFSACKILPVSTYTLRYAAELVKHYKFQLFDAIIVAASIEGHCDILYSEDMQHKLIVDNKLTIINPFLIAN